MAKAGSSGKHGGGHKVRERGRNASDRKQAEREKQARISAKRGKSTSGKKGKPSGQEKGGDVEETF